MPRPTLLWGGGVAKKEVVRELNLWRWLKVLNFK
jgi:hypothetical protein